MATAARRMVCGIDSRTATMAGRCWEIERPKSRCRVSPTNSNTDAVIDCWEGNLLYCRSLVYPDTEAIGVFEFLTCPFETPPDFEPILDPEFPWGHYQDPAQRESKKKEGKRRSVFTRER